MDDSVKELKGLMKESFKEFMNENESEKFQAQRDEDYAKLLEENENLKAAEEARIESKGIKVDLTTPTGEKVDFIYKGYDLRRQCLDLSIADEDRKQRHAKFMIDIVKSAAMTEETGAVGGYLVPDEYELDVMALARLKSVALRECQIFNVGRDTLKIPVELTGTSVDTQAFGTANSESEPTLSEITLDMKRIGNHSIVYNDLLEDSFFDIASWLTALNAEAIGQKIDEYVFTGSTFTGDLYDLTTNIITVSGSNGSIADISYSHFSEALSKLTDNKLEGAKFYFNRAVTHYVRTERDSNGRPIWIDPTSTGPAHVYGYPYVQVEKLTAAPSAGGAFGVFGNLKHYYLGVRKGMTMQKNEYLYMAEGKTQFVCHNRVDGDCGIEPALVLFKLTA